MGNMKRRIEKLERASRSKQKTIIVKDDPGYQDHQEAITGTRPISPYTVNGESITEDQLQKWRDDPGIEVLMITLVRDWKGGGDREIIK